MVPIALLLILSWHAPGGLPSTPPAPSCPRSAQEATPREAGPSADELWRDTIRASRPGEGDPRPIEAFHLFVDLLTRQGTSSNQAKVSLAFRAPHLIRFNAGDGKEMGRAGLKQRDHWLRSGERVVMLQGREYEEDRRQIQTMHALARNFIAISDPARLEVADVERLEEPPQGLPRKLRRIARGLNWLSFQSPDFALTGDASTGPGATGFSVEFGLAAEGDEASLPILALIHDAVRDGHRLPPMLIHLERYALLDGFRVPHWILVHQLDPATSTPEAPRFQEEPGQEIYLLESSSLRPVLPPEVFARPE